MNKKLRRLMQPNLALFFVVMALFCAAAVALQEYILAVAEGCATLLLLGCYQWLSVRRRRALADYVQATSEMPMRSTMSSTCLIFSSRAHFRHRPSFVLTPFSTFVIKITAMFFLHRLQMVGFISSLLPEAVAPP